MNWFKHFINGDPAVAVSSMPDINVTGGLSDEELRDTPIEVNVNFPTQIDADDPDYITPIPIQIDTDLHGQQPLFASMPVALAKEQMLDYMAPTLSLQAPVINAVLTMVNCLQYRSVAIQIITTAGTAAGVLTFEQSNDGANWVVTPLIDQAATNSIAVSTVTLAASTNRFFNGPVMYQWFRVRVSTAVTGIAVSCVAIFRMAPFSFATCVDNIGQWGGTGVVAGGVAGMPAVGGNIAAGTAPTANPLPMGGVDESATPLTRRIVTDSWGYQAVTGTTPLKSTFPVRIRDYAEDGTQPGLNTLLNKILWELKFLNYLQASTPDVMNQMNGTYNYTNSDDFRNDFEMNQVTIKGE